MGLVIASCKKEEPLLPPTEDIVFSGDMIITDTISTEVGEKVIIKPGTNLTFGPEGLLIVNGELIAIGKPDSLISFFGDINAPDQLILKTGWDATNIHLKHVVITDGLVRSLADDNLLQHVKFVNTKQLKWDSALIRLWFGNMTIEDCEAYGNNRGEGILAHNMIEAVVQRCRFEKVPDAVEFIDINNGLITDNIFIDNADDAIDQNSCVGTTISNNEFYGTHDRALELGSENYGSSRNLVIHNNLFVDCNTAISLKESSDATITNATFYSNTRSIDVQTPSDSLRLSQVTLNRSIFIQESTPIRTDHRSTVSLSNCLSDLVLFEGENNVTGSVTFDIDANRQISVSSDAYPAGQTASTIGYQQ